MALDATRFRAKAHHQDPTLWTALTIPRRTKALTHEDASSRLARLDEHVARAAAAARS